MKLILNIAIIFLLASCNSAKTNKASEPTKGLPLASQWILESFNDTEIKNISKSSYITIKDNLTNYEGNGGCNSMGGVLKVKDNSIKFEPGMMTQMACEALTQESKFVSNLHAATNYKIVGGQLFLYQNEKLLMTLESYRN